MTSRWIGLAVLGLGIGLGIATIAAEARPGSGRGNAGGARGHARAMENFTRQEARWQGNLNAGHRRAIEAHNATAARFRARELEADEDRDEDMDEDRDEDRDETTVRGTSRARARRNRATADGSVRTRRGPRIRTGTDLEARSQVDVSTPSVPPFIPPGHRRNLRP